MAGKSNKKILFTLTLAAVIVFGLGYMFINAGINSIEDQEAVQVRTNSNTGNDNYPMAPDFTLKDLDNRDVSLSDYRGKVVFVNFWATWCAPCKMEIPYFIDLVNQYDDEGFIVLGIAIDQREFPKIPAFADLMGINYPVLYDKKHVSILYGGIRNIPTTFVINREGRAVERIIGSRPREVFESIVKKWL